MSTQDRAGWANQQLIEFLAALSAGADEPTTLATAVEQAVEAVEAEVGAVLAAGSVVTSIGFGRSEVPVDSLLRAADRAGPEAQPLPGLGPCWVASAAVQSLPGGVLLVARSGERFSRAEVALLRAMTRVLDLTVDSVRNLALERALREAGERQAEANRQLIVSLQERQDLLERLAVIQNQIASRSPIDTTLDAVLDAAAALLGEETVGLRLVDPLQPDEMVLVAGRGLGPSVAASSRRSRTADGIGGQAIREGRLVATDSYAESPAAMPAFLQDGVVAAMAAPLLGTDGPMGSLVVASRTPGRTFSDRDQQVLLALAEHAKLALNDARTVEALEQALESATHRATHDVLTGLPNRMLFRDRLEHALARSSRVGSTLAVLFVDVDEFKLVNDTLGHHLGDVLLRAVAERLTTAVRGSDTAARLGGDEFALLLEDVDAAEVASCAQRLLTVLRDPLSIEGHEVLSRASIGVAVTEAGNREPSELLREADVAMYQAKAQGKDRWVLFEPGMHEPVRRRRELELALHRALEQQEFVLWYQPIVDLVTREVRGVEALVRWQDPHGSLVSPAEFIPLAEETGLMVPLGRWVLAEACRRAAEWRSGPGRAGDISVSVNISPRQLRDPGLVDDVRSALRDSGLPASALCLELTESALIADTDAAHDRLRQLKGLGVALAIDDFGTGYSSLGYLRRLPVDELKIDKTFVDDLTCTATAASLAQVIVTLAQTLGMRAVAEGVESEGQATTLRDIGCPQAQGYLFHRPMPAAEIGLLLSGRPHAVSA